MKCKDCTEMICPHRTTDGERELHRIIKEAINNVDTSYTEPDKKYCVRIYFNTFVEHEVYAHDEEEAYAAALGEGADIEEVYDHLSETHKYDVWRLD